MTAIINRMNRYLNLHPTLKKWTWFVAIYVLSIIVFAIISLALQTLVPK